MSKETKAEKMARVVAEEISAYRKEFIEQLFGGIDKEATEIAGSGYDPAKGQGRGPWWANGD